MEMKKTIYLRVPEMTEFIGRKAVKGGALRLLKSV